MKAVPERKGWRPWVSTSQCKELTKQGSTDSGAFGATLGGPSETLCGNRSQFCAAGRRQLNQFRLMFSGSRSDDDAMDGPRQEIETNDSYGGRRADISGTLLERRCYRHSIPESMDVVEKFSMQ